AYKGGGWPWDRAFMQAAAYLAVMQALPVVARSETPNGAFPYWVALDKHTPAGKTALREGAKRLKLPARQGMWRSFYFESALVNDSSPSYWWTRETQWRLKQVGLTPEAAQTLWQTVRPVVADLLDTGANALRQHLENETHGVKCVATDPEPELFPNPP